MNNQNQYFKLMGVLGNAPTFLAVSRIILILLGMILLWTS